ncbi:MAG: phage tail sheath family protein [Desulfobacteraceae bacterium]|nr:phage tail sheath family protein [Desulfobacteraceae bacterium]
MSYKHGVYVSEQQTSIVPPRRISAALPVVIGTAPVHQVSEGSWPVNTPVLAYTYQEAVAAFGYSDDWENYTLCEFFKAFFGLYGVGPVVVINVLDPAAHRFTFSETKSFSNNALTLENSGLLSDPIVKDAESSADNEIIYNIDIDYSVDRQTGVITRLENSVIGIDTKVTIDYTHIDPGAVTTEDVCKGLEKIETVFPKFRLIPGQIVAPGWSHNSGVATVMAACASKINGLFDAVSIVDIDNSVTDYTLVAKNKKLKNLCRKNQIVCWPKVCLDGKEYWMSSHIAGLIAKVDADNSDIPHSSPSNKNLQIDSAVAGGSEVWLSLEQANSLNAQGIVTALNFVGGWKCWGNRTSVYPSETDVKDAFIPIRRMFNWIGNTLITTYWQKVDFPITRRLIETVVDSANIWLNGLTAREYILGGRLEFAEDENPATDIMDGIIRFHCYITPPSPARQIEFILEYDPAYLQTLFG